jgi:hypothetical protein
MGQLNALKEYGLLNDWDKNKKIKTRNPVILERGGMEKRTAHATPSLQPELI